MIFIFNKVLELADLADAVIELSNIAIEISFERDQATVALDDAYEFIESKNLWNEFRKAG